MERTRSRLPAQDTRSTAAHLRALVLRGADQVVQDADDPIEAERQRLIDASAAVKLCHPETESGALRDEVVRWDQTRAVSS